MPDVSVSEVHRYPSRPLGFEEPLFPTPDSKRAVAEHLLEAPWLQRASELGGRAGAAAHALDEPVRLKVGHGRAEVVRLDQGRRCCRRRLRVLEVLESWREIKEWWDRDLRVDRFVFRVLFSGGVVADLARERSGGWLLVGMVD